MNSSVEQRRDRILEILKEQGSVNVVSLSRRFGVSQVIIRKDLACLEALGMLERRHGGATRVGRGYLYKDLEERMDTRRAQKEAIARAAAREVSPGQVVLMNSGSTNVFVARELSHVGNVVLVTNALRVASEFAEAESGEVILLGGRVKSRHQFSYGPDTLRFLRKYHGDVCFVSVDGVAADNGLTSYYHAEAETIRHMLERATRRVVVADSTKIGRISLEHVGDVGEIHVLITDDGADPAQVEACESRGVTVRRVSPTEEPQRGNGNNPRKRR